jgi:hypothetical protein
MTKELLEIGRRVQAAYASSFAEGSKILNEIASPGGYLHVHIPGVSHKQDGEWITPASDYGSGQADVFAKINLRVAVNDVRQLGDDLLVLEAVFSASLPDGRDVTFDDVIMWTFVNGRVVRQVQVASTEMWDTLRDALVAVNAPGYGAGTEYWKDEASMAARYPGEKLSQGS